MTELWICRGATFFCGRRSGATRSSIGCAKDSKAVSSHSTPKLFPFAGKLQGALVDGLTEGLVRRERGEPFGLRLALVSHSGPHAPLVTQLDGLIALWRWVVQLHTCVTHKRVNPFLTLRFSQWWRSTCLIVRDASGRRRSFPTWSLSTTILLELRHPAMN